MMTALQPHGYQPAETEALMILDGTGPMETVGAGDAISTTNEPISVATFACCVLLKSSWCF